MVVTEIALLCLKNGSPLSAESNRELKSKLFQAIGEQATYSGSEVFLLAQHEDPTYIYILGKWASVSQHMDEWVPSEKNQGLLRWLEDDIEVIAVMHLDMDPSPVEARGLEEEERIPYECATIAIGRYFITPGKKGLFETAFAEMKASLKDYIKPKTMIGGWRLDPAVDEEGRPMEEFVLVSGWNSPEEHLGFVESGEFKEFMQIKELLRGSDIKHAQLQKAA